MLERIRMWFKLSLLFMSVGLSTISLAEAEVRLAWAQSIQCPPVSGCFSREGLSGVIEVRNLSFHKEVELVYKPVWSQSWQSAPASYLAPAKDGYEAWHFRVEGPVEAFALAYKNGTQIFWDNNEGRDYRPARYRHDAFLGQGHDFAGLSGFFREETRELRIFLIVDPSRVQAASIHADDGQNTETFTARRVQELASGLELWESQGMLGSELELSNLRLSASSAEAVDTNYGFYYTVRNGLITAF